MATSIWPGVTTGGGRRAGSASTCDAGTGADRRNDDKRRTSGRPERHRQSAPHLVMVAVSVGGRCRRRRCETTFDQRLRRGVCPSPVARVARVVGGGGEAGHCPTQLGVLSHVPSATTTTTT
eukprot:ctg_2723.g382